MESAGVMEAIRFERAPQSIEAPAQAVPAVPTVPTTASDWELVAEARGQCADGLPADAFAGLFERHSAAVFTYLLRFTGDRQLAEDLTQETFLTAYRHLPDLSPERVTGGPTATLRPWLMRVARNRAISQFRRCGASLAADGFCRGGIDEGGIDLGAADPQAGPEEETLRRETADEVRAAVGKLAPLYREPLLLYYSGGLTYGEIASVLGLPLGTVATRIRRGVAAVSRELRRFRG